jgi:predicted transcriptional regulator
MSDHDTTLSFVDLTASLIAAYVAHNSVPAEELPGLIGSVHATLAGLGAPAAPAEPEVERPTAAQIRKSVTPDAITSFLDGKPYKSLKRHLTTRGYTPESYRQAFGLDVTYPMVAANYAAQRSELAKASGLGSSRKLRAVPAAA